MIRQSQRETIAYQRWLVEHLMYIMPTRSSTKQILSFDILLLTLDGRRFCTNVVCKAEALVVIKQVKSGTNA